jgi:tRNA uridine 5-carboxymethylaminomethyl modification enzyme
MAWTYPEKFEVIVVGAGHAGCEAALASARAGANTLLLTMNLDTIAKMSCNPAIGGVAKGQLVREIDAMGGEMAKVADRTGIQFRMLNASKGPAVWSPRAQVDKVAYQFEMKKRIENCPNLYLHQATTEELICENQQVKGVRTKEGVEYLGNCVIISSGTFMKGTIHIGDLNFSGGRTGDLASVGLSKSLNDLGFKLGKLKTGTPPRVNRRSIDMNKMEEQAGEKDVFFSHSPCTEEERLTQTSCFITYTNAKTKEIAENNLKRSSLFSGNISSIGPRYCPSFEDKVVRFSEKVAHQIFIEPEGLNTQELYINGISTSLPFDVQMQMIQSLEGMENAQITRPGYAIEYDYVVCGQINASLETKTIDGLFLAGQINGTTGYEEAAAQGLIAGINAAKKVQKKPPVILKRYNSYIGVMIDDIITQEFHEPYRVFTSRAEYRLLLRQDNADLRLTAFGHEAGLVSDEQAKKVQDKQETIDSEIKRLEKTYRHYKEKSLPLSLLLSRPEMSYQMLLELFPEDIKDFDPSTNFQLELHFRYAGYIERQKQDIAKLTQVEKIKIPKNFSYDCSKNLRTEAKEKLMKVQPENLGQASRIAGVSPADISILMVSIRSKELLKNADKATATSSIS